jgi:adenosine deaminase
MTGAGARSGRRGYHREMRDLRALPKAELHIHLEGSVRTATVRDLAERNGVPAPSGLDPIDGWRFRDFLDFIGQYTAVCDLLTSLEDVRRLGYEVCQDLASNGVRYAEAVFSPSNHAERLGDWFGPIEAALDGLAAGERDFGVQVRLCPDIVRDVGMEAAEHVFEVAAKFAGRGVVALNASGTERAAVEPFGEFFHRAKDAGLRCVPHAGEWAGPQNVWQTLRHYEPDRIGHGVRSIDDPELVRHLAGRGIPLEVAPVSNVSTGVYPSLAEHPLPALREAGVIVTLNSDDPAMFDAWAADVYRASQAAWGLSDEELAGLARAGVVASFAEDDVRASILAGIDEWLASPA